MLAEFKDESSNMRRKLERVPGDKLTWKPHNKCYTVGRLATHVALIPSSVSRIINHKEFDFAKKPTPRNQG
jgi:hypothetical protein